MKKRIIKIIVFLSVFILIFLFLSEVLTVNDDTSLANIKGFYLEPENTLDVALIGPSEFYADYSATQAWEEYGYTSYSLAVAGVPGSLYKSMLTEVLKRQNPKLVIFEVNGFLLGDDYLQRQANLHSWIDNIPWSENKIQTIQETIPKEMRYSYYIKLATYHDNWRSIGDCLACMDIKRKMDSTGYSFTKGFGTYTTTCDDSAESDDIEISFDKNSREYFKELLEYCKASGVENVLFVRFPHGRRIKNVGVLDEVQAMVSEYGYDFLNLNDYYEQIGLDKKEDFYNPEHLNINGMTKMTKYFGQYLCENYDIQSEHSEELTSYWNKCADQANDLMDECREDLHKGNKKRYFEISAYKHPKKK